MFYLEMRKLECHNMATYLAQERKYVQSWPKTTLIVQMASYQPQKTFIYLGISKGHLYNFFVFILLCLNLVVKRELWTVCCLKSMTTKTLGSQWQNNCKEDKNEMHIWLPRFWPFQRVEKKRLIISHQKIFDVRNFNCEMCSLLLSDTFWLLLNITLDYFLHESRWWISLWNNYNDINMKHIKFEIETLESIKTSG